MKNKLLGKGLAFIAGSLLAMTLATSANAASLSIVGGSNFNLNNKFSLATNTGLAIGTTVKYFDSSTDGSSTGLFLAGAPTDVTFEYLGSEAGNQNRAVEYEGTNTALFSNHGGSSVGESKTIGFVNNGALQFWFQTGSSLAKNAGSIADGLVMAFYQESATSVIALFGDAGGDQDYDDMAMRISVTAVPLPAALPLYGAGLAVLGFVGWRRKQKLATAAV